MRVLHTVTALVVMSAIGTIAAPASAQVVDVRVKVDTQAIREATEEIREALRDVFGPEMRREMTGLSRDVAAAIEHLARAPWGGDGGWVDSVRQRNFPARQTDKETRTFAIGANGEFDLDSLSGDIRITPGPGRDLTIQITRLSRGRTEADARNGLSRVTVETTHRGDRATARTVYPDGRQSDFSVTVDYVVTAPAGTRITAKTVSGDVTVGAITGEVSVHTTSGDVRVTGATRLVAAKTISGDIVLQDTKAEGLLEAGTMSGNVTATNVSARRLTMSTISGDVASRNVDAGDVKFSTMSGDVRFDGAIEPRGRYDFTSQSGTVRLSLDGRTGFTLEAQSFNGAVTSELELTLTNPGTTGRRFARQLRGTFGDGSATITARSFSGSVVLVRR